MNRPSLRSIDIWADCEKSIIATLREALCILNQNTDISKNENGITEDFSKTIHSIRFKRDRATISDYGTITIQTQNQPISPLGISEHENSLRKRPDMLWSFYDENAESPEKSQRHFTIECKCLDDRSSAKDYIEKGVSRFILNDWGYGRGEKSSAMIGYVIASEYTVYREGISKHNQRLHYSDIIETSCEANSNSTKQFVQDFLNREFEPRKFRLHHLWVNLGC